MKGLMRSLLFIPGHNERLFNSASGSDADVLLLDIEDSVQPQSNKQVARDTIQKWVESGKLNKFLIFARINDRESGHLLKDVHQLTIDGITGFMYPKAKCGDDIYFIDKLLETIEYEKKIPIGTYKLIPLIETTAAVLNAQDICKASKRVIAIAFGCEDFITDLQGIHDDEHLSLFSPRALIAMAARATGVIPIDTVHIKVHDLEDLEINLKLVKKLGFEGMMVLHPKELELVHKYFSPSEQEINDAEEMLRLYNESQQEGKGVALKNGKFIGPPMVGLANSVLEKQKLIKNKYQK
ncbi:MAG TPA: CoA ester lyase [Bacteroidales bacterium]|nr:CoA ester lyase [Bacteroidales bacterium]